MPVPWSALHVSEGSSVSGVSVPVHEKPYDGYAHPVTVASGAQVAYRFNSYIALALAERLQGAPGLAGSPVPLPTGEVHQRSIESMTAGVMQYSPARFVKSPVAVETVGEAGLHDVLKQVISGDRAGRQANDGGDDSQCGQCFHKTEGRNNGCLRCSGCRASEARKTCCAAGFLAH